MPLRRSILRRPLAALAVALLVTGPATCPAATYHVDIATGVDDAARDGLSPATAWRTVTFAVRRLPVPGPHDLMVAAGEHSQASGEIFPLEIPFDVSLLGAGPDLTVFHDQGNAGVGTIRWTVDAQLLPPGTPVLSGFTVVRDRYVGQPVGSALDLRADDVDTSPRVTNVVLRGAARGLDLYAEAELAGTVLSPLVDSCLFLENGIGVLSTAYTATGVPAETAPQFVNCVAQGNLSDGFIFESAANWDLPVGQRTNAASRPVLTHCTISDNLGSALLLDNSNGYIRYRSGPVQPIVTNSVLTGNGDYALHEYTTATDPARFDYNLIGGNLVALYKDEGAIDIYTLGSMPIGTGNIDAEALFVGGLGRDWHLRGDSPGIDAAPAPIPPVDLDGDARPFDGNGDGTDVADMGADEAWPCAVDALIEPAVPPERCGIEPALLLSAATSAPAAGFTCGGPLQFTWYADGVEVATSSDLSVVPPRTTSYTVVVRCLDFPSCQDSATVVVIVHSLPVADAEAGVAGTATGDYEACVAWDAADVTVALLGTAEATDPGTILEYTEWVAADGILLGSASLNPLLAVTNTGLNQVIPVSLTAVDLNGCSFTSFTNVHVFRGPRPLPGGPYAACQDVDSTQTFVPLAGDADVPPGSAPATWLWRTDVGRFEDSGAATSTLRSPRLQLTNFAFDRTVNLTLEATDDKGCTDDAVTTLVLHHTPKPETNGPYQEPEAPVSPTSIPVSGTVTGPAGTTLRWTTDLGTFQSTGTATADGADQVLDIANTGTDQLGQLCLVATPPSGPCEITRCTAVSVRVSPAQPPNDVGGTVRLVKSGGVARWSWTNPPIDAEHDRAETFDVWESALPGPGAWTPRANLQDVPRVPGGTTADDALLLDLAGPDLLFLKVVSENTGGACCADPAAELPDCASLENCANGVDDDGDRRIDCADPGCTGIPPC